jgi:hypothetical protein
VSFLGHIISNGGITVDPAKVKGIVAWSIPTTVTEIQSFLGLAGYYWRFIEGFSKDCEAYDHTSGEGKRVQVGREMPR